MPSLVFDFETYLIQPGLLAPPPVCMAYLRPEPAYTLGLLSPAEGVGFLEECLDRGLTIIGHNVAYDFGVACAYSPSLVPKVFAAYAAGRIRCTQVRQKLIDIAAGCLNLPRPDGTRGASLATLEKHYLGVDRSAEKYAENAWRKRYAELDGVPLDQWPEEAVEYPKRDVVGTLKVFEAQASKVLPSEADDTRADWALHLMSCWGIRTDGDAVAALEAALKAAQAKNAKWLHKAGFYKTRRATPTEVSAGEVAFWEESKRGPRPMVYAKDMAAVQEAVVKYYGRRGVTVPLTDSGRIATDRDTLLGANSRILETLADGGGVDKLLTTYVPALKQGVEIPVNVRFNVLVESGRTSSSSDRETRSGFNIQNMPTGKKSGGGGVRECFIPRPGFYFVSVDYDTLELRALAQQCLDWFGASKMADALRAGRDLHVEMAANMLGISYEEATARRKAKDPVIKNARDLAKVANFGLPGGLGARTLVDWARKSPDRVIMTERQAYELKAQWLQTWPEMKLYFARVNTLVGLGDADITSFDGMVRGAVNYTAACNHFFQNRAARGAKRACFAVQHECYSDESSPLYGSRPVAFIHDEILAEVPIDVYQEASSRLARVMCDAMASVIPDIPVTAAPAVMERWYKAAEPTYSDGHLDVWRPLAA